MKCPVVLLALGALLLAGIPRALGQDDQYVQIFSLIQQGDVLHNARDAGPALSKYLEAQNRLRQFQKMYPDWNTQVVNFRLNYLAGQIADVTPKTAVTSTPATGEAATTSASPSAPNSPSPPADVAEQVRSLQGTIRQLQADNMVLEAKVREAFAAQPAAVDSRELAKAENQIRSLEKENALMRVTLTRQQTVATPAPDTNSLERLNQQLSTANQKLAEQTQRAEKLALETVALQSRIENPAAVAHGATSAETAAALQETSRKLAEQTELAVKLARERDELAARANAVQGQNEMLTGLRAENEVLKKQLAQSKSAPTAEGSDALTKRLAAAETRIAALESDTQILNLEKAALQNKVRSLAGTPATAPATATAASTSDSTRVKTLERETASLQKQLQAARKELDSRKAKNGSSRIEALNGQVELLRARLGVYEAQSVPYSTEELALFKQPDGALTQGGSKAAQKSVHDLPAGTATLVAEARRDFAAHDFQKAESLYSQVLQKDEKNVYTLANLATIQLELNHLEDAEKHVNQALALAPDDSYSLLVLGEIKFKEQKYRDSLDSLSRAAKLDPQNPEIQNFLGLALSQEGQRKPAETAFRKAIELDPAYGSAHNNLAVFYATQRPPSPGLARWHYQKALAAGFPPNPDLEKLLGNESPSQASQ